MRNRILVAAAALTVALLGACTSRSSTQISSSASVTINGHERTFHIVKCGQREWTRMIDIGSNFSGAEVIVDEGAQPAATQSVRIRNVGGFSGMYSRGAGGNADMSMTGDKFTLSGSANGYRSDNPSEPATATFKIVVTC